MLSTPAHPVSLRLNLNTLFRLPLLLFLLLTVLLTTPLHAATDPIAVYDASLDFSPTANPSGVWSYGYESELGGGFTLYSTHGFLDATLINYWSNNSTSKNPSVSQNLTNNKVYNGSANFEQGQTVFHPGPNGEYSLIRFTVPTSGSYQLNSMFYGIDHLGPTTTDVHVLKNSELLYSGVVNSFGVASAKVFDNLLTLQAGDYIDFAVGRGGNGSYYNDSTAIQAIFSLQSPKQEQTVTFGTAPTLIVGGTGTVSATASSGLAVSFTSLTPDVCSVSDSTITAQASGTCTIAADQAGNASYAAAAQVTQDITVTAPMCVSPASGLIGWWSGDGNANDAFGSNHGTLMNGATFTAGNVGQAFSFDGGNYVGLNIPTINTTNGTQVTVEFWMYWDGTDYQMPFGFTEYSLFFWNGTFGFNTGNSDVWGVSNAALANQWVHVGAVFNNGDATQNKLFINGVLQPASQQLGITGTKNVSALTRISGWLSNEGYKFAGRIDELKIYNGALSTEQIASIYDAGSAGVCKSLTAQTIGAITFAPTNLSIGTTSSASASGGGSGNPVTFTSLTPAICSASGTNGSTITGLTSGTCTIAANQAGNTSYDAAAQVTQSIDISSAGITYTLSGGASPLTQWGVDDDVIVSLNGIDIVYDRNYLSTSFAPLSFTANPGDVLIISAYDATPYSRCYALSPLYLHKQDGAFYAIDPAGVPGICDGALGPQGPFYVSITTFNNDGSFATVPGMSVSDTQSIGSISFTQATLAIGGSTMASATATSGLPVSFTSLTPDFCSVTGTNGSTMTGLAAGTCTVAADQSGNESYDAAPQVTKDIPVFSDACASKLSGIVSWWQAEENANDRTYTSNGTLENGVVFAPGKVGQAFNFSTLNSYVYIQDNSAFAFVDKPFTIGAWVKRTGNFPGTAGFGAIFDRLLPGTPNGYRLDYSTERNHLRLAGSTPLEIAYTLDLDQWYHIAAVSDGAGIAMIYVNGVVVGTGDYASSLPYDVAPRIGNAQNNDAAFQGLIDEVQIYNRVLFAAEIQAIYSADSSGVCTPVELAGQTLTPVTFATTTLTVGNTTTASASGGASGNPVTFTSLTPATCSVTGTNGSTITGLTAGTCTIAANQAGNASYDAAAQVTNDVTVISPACTPLPTGLVGWWRGDGTASDQTGSNSDALMTNGASYGTGLAGQAFALNGTGIVDLTISAIDTTPGNNVTAQFWMFWNGQDNVIPFGFDKYALYLYGGSFGFTTGGNIYGINNTGFANRWVHVAAIFNNGDMTQSRLFIDGVEQSLAILVSNADPVPMSVTPRIVLGTWLVNDVYANSIHNYSFPGLIDELQIYNRALTSAEIQSIYLSGSAGVCTPLAAQAITSFAFSSSSLTVGTTSTASASGGASGNPVTFTSLTPAICSATGSNGSTITGLTSGTCTIAADQAGNADYGAAPQVTQDITVTTPVCASPSSGLISWWKGENNANDTTGSNHGTMINGATFAPGKVGQAFNFDGVNDYVTIPKSGDWAFGDGDFSIDLWTKFTSVKSGLPDSLPNVFIGQDENANNYNKWIFYLADDGLGFHVNGSVKAFIGHIPFSPIPGSWYHLALTRIGNTYSFFVNGTLAGTAIDANPIPSVDAPLMIGQAEGLGYLNGFIDEPKIYNRALIVTEIQAIYNAGTAGVCALPPVTVTFTAGSSGTLTGTATQTVDYNTSTTAVTAVPDPGYHFVNWSGDNGFVTTTDNPLTVTNVTTSQTITANFAPDPLDGLCGSSDGQTFTSAPTENLCTTGAASALLGSGPWSWSCSGAHGGGDADCSAQWLDTVGPTLILSTLPNGSVTTNDLLNISGTITDLSGVTHLIINNVVVAITDDTFSYPLALQPGTNSIVTVAIDALGNQTRDQRLVTLDPAAPLLVVSEPADNSAVAGAIVTINGTIAPSSTVTIQTNGGDPEHATILDDTFSGMLLLTPGLNTVIVTATDLAGQHASVARTLTYNAALPALAMTTPAQDHKTAQNSLPLSGTVSATTTVTVTVDFNETTYTPTVTDGVFALTLDLPTEGRYPLVVTAADEANNRSRVVRNILYALQPPPVWTTLYPRLGSFSATTVDVLVRTEQDSTAYLVCLPGGAVPPTPEQIRDGEGADGSPLAANLHSSVALTAQTPATLACTALSSQNYDLYTVAADNDGRLQPNPVKLTTIRRASGVTLTASQSSPQALNAAITFTAKATGGDNGAYEYRFWLKSTVAGSKWAIAQNYSLSTTWDWNPAALALTAGSYAIQVDVRHLGNSDRSEAVAVMKYTLYEPATSVALLPNPVSPATIGTTVTLTADAVGSSTGSYEYRFWWKLNVPSATWAIGQNYSTSHIWTWNTAALPAGTYAIQVDTRPVGNIERKEFSKLITYVLYAPVGSPATSVTVDSTPISPTAAGTTVTFNAVAHGGDVGPYEYRFWWRSSLAGSTWSIGQNYSPATSWDWDTSALGLNPGNYYLQIDTRHVGNPARSEAVKVMNFILQ